MCIGLYIHIPFCESKCPYCNFYSFIPGENDMDNFTIALCRHMKSFLENNGRVSIDTIYFGGGTPSLLKEKRLSYIMDFIYKSFDIKHPEATLEINPARGKALNFKALKSIGFNRLSVGLQSAINDDLKFLNRLNTSQDAYNTIYNAKKSGFDNISADLMIALPYQTKENITTSIEFCSIMDIQHVSSYMLKIEPHTPFYNIKDDLLLKDDEESADMYIHTCKALEQHGFFQYEISNFAKPGFKSKHNLKYWSCDEYIGFGPSAHSFFRGKRFYYNDSFKDFIENSRPVFDCIGGTQEEYIMLRLRLNEGLKSKDFEKRFSKSIDEYINKAKKYIDNGLIIKDKEGIKLTREGFLISNTIIADILL